jgi:hypothetical protein
LGVTPLLNNHQHDKSFHQILVFTGHRKDAGTKSKVKLRFVSPPERFFFFSSFRQVSFLLADDDDGTTIRTFVDPHRPTFQRAGIDAFVMSVPKTLARLSYLRIWHDNSN